MTTSTLQSIPGQILGALARFALVLSLSLDFMATLRTVLLFVLLLFLPKVVFDDLFRRLDKAFIRSLTLFPLYFTVVRSLCKLEFWGGYWHTRIEISVLLAIWACIFRVNIRLHWQTRLNPLDVRLDLVLAIFSMELRVQGIHLDAALFSATVRCLSRILLNARSCSMRALYLRVPVDDHNLWVLFRARLWPFHALFIFNRMPPFLCFVQTVLLQLILAVFECSLGQWILFMLMLVSTKWTNRKTD